MKIVASVEAQGNDPVMRFVMALLDSITSTHIMHWTTGSYAQHQALGEYYAAIEELVDTWVEAFTGRYGVLTQFPPVGAIFNGDPAPYLTQLNKNIAEMRSDAKFPQDTALQNIVDEIVAQIDTTLFKLNRLK